VAIGDYHLPIGVGYLERRYLWGGVGLEMPPRMDQFEEHGLQLRTLSTRINTQDSMGGVPRKHTHLHTEQWLDKDPTAFRGMVLEKPA
jgi:hypothetical protein